MTGIYLSTAELIPALEDWSAFARSGSRPCRNSIHSPYADRVTDPIVSIDLDHVAVEPGGQASVTVTVRNPGTIVEGYQIEVVGEGVSQWADVLPPEVSVYPQQEATAVIVFSPPGGTGAPGGTWPFGIRVRSTEDADASAVAEGDLEIGKVFGLQAKLLPVNSSGRWNGRHVIQITNWGNSPVTLKLSATDADQALGFMIRPDVVELPLGGTATARLWAKTKSPTLRGTATRIPFTVAGERQGAPPPQAPPTPYGGSLDRPTVDGAFNQKPILTKTSVMVAVLALLGIGGGVAWLLTHPLVEESTFAELGPPPAPAAVKVDTLGPESLRVGWAAVPDVTAYTVVEVLADGSRTGSKDVTATDNALTFEGLKPATEVCYAVQAKRDKLLGPFSEKECGTTAALAASPSPTDGGSGSPSESASTGDPGSPSESGEPSQEPTSATSTGPGNVPVNPSKVPTGAATTANPDFKGKWFAADFWDPNVSIFDPADRLAKLQAVDKRAGIVSSDLYPQITLNLQATNWVLFIGPFDTRAEAEAACPTVKKVQPGCLSIQLDP